MPVRFLKLLIMQALRSHPDLYERASRVYHKLLRYNFKPANAETEAALLTAFRTAHERQSGGIGDYYEFGVYKGASLWAAYKAASHLSLSEIRFLGFDSFKGLHDIKGVDADGRFYSGQFACSRQEVERNLDQRGIDWSRTHLFEGFYHETLTEDLHSRFNFRKAGVVLIDCSLYASTTVVLSWLHVYLQEGSVILFDDWTAFGKDKMLGQQKAFSEFRSEHPDIFFEDLGSYPHNGRIFVVKGRTS